MDAPRVELRQGEALAEGDRGDAKLLGLGVELLLD
eukprot:SAG22_NODE_13363_length_409_cov_0.993548_1_plen_34_part_01